MSSQQTPSSFRAEIFRCPWISTLPPAEALPLCRCCWHGVPIRIRDESNRRLANPGLKASGRPVERCRAAGKSDSTETLAAPRPNRRHRRCSRESLGASSGRAKSKRNRSSTLQAQLSPFREGGKASFLGHTVTVRPCAASRDWGNRVWLSAKRAHGTDIRGGPPCWRTRCAVPGLDNLAPTGEGALP
jgi:hypothetical protein